MAGWRRDGDLSWVIGVGPAGASSKVVRLQSVATHRSGAGRGARCAGEQQVSVRSRFPMIRVLLAQELRLVREGLRRVVDRQGGHDRGRRIRRCGRDTGRGASA